MKTALCFICSLVFCGLVHSQNTAVKLYKAIKNLEADSQMKSAILGFYVTGVNGEIICAENSAFGLAAASCQKVITSVASFELLGIDYRYKTEFGYSGKVNNGTLNGNIYITGNGDPTLGSWRFNDTKEQVVLDKLISALKNADIKQINGNFIFSDKRWESQTIPGGWVWDDIGNYYGAGATALNWRENQYDLILQPGKKAGDKVNVVATKPTLFGVNLINELMTGEPKSGDNGYIYLPPYSKNGYVRGTVPAGKNTFTISGSVPNPAMQLRGVFIDELQRQGITVNLSDSNDNLQTLAHTVNLLTLYSPPLDSINYWFLKRSINLYGEALLKTLGFGKKKQGSTEAGLNVLKSFWAANGIDSISINIIDGSGLSPGNRVTPEALVKVMQYAQTRPWFSSFYNALPEINGIKMKSGSIGGARSFTGYAADYTFAIVIDNYNGSSVEIVRKMYRLLDILK